MSTYLDIARNAMNSTDTSSSTELIYGTNGTLEHTAQSVGDARVALFFALVRNIPDERLTQLMNNCVGDIAASDEPCILADLFVLAFQTRDCRGGKGERDLFYKMLLHLYREYPNTVLQLLNLFGEYGYYKDYFKLMELADGVPQYQLLCAKITDLLANQLIADEAILEGKPGTAGSKREISLCAKYCPREGKHFAAGKNSTAFSDLINKLYPPTTGAHKQGRKQYRQLISRLTKALDIPEVKMCGKRYSELMFTKVPSVCAKKFCKAFLNEKVKIGLTPAEEETGNRFPDSEDRIMCRQNLRQAVLDQKVKGKQLHPHEIVKTLYEGRNVSSMEKEVYNVQWKDIRANLLAQLAAAQGDGATAKAINVGKLVPLSDVSGSMSGIPMLVSIALGILVSEVNHPAFRDRVLTFESNPTWVDLSALSTIAQKVEKLRHAPWGGSTNVSKAFERILAVVRENRLPEAEVPDLIIFSDMQFDVAFHGEAAQSTQLEQIRKMFHDVGVEISGAPYAAPKIIFWNLQGNTVGFPAQAADENVQMLSGFSPSLLKFVLEGGDVEETEEVVTESGEVVTVAKAKPTPYETVRKVLDDARYHAVRELLSASTEGALAQYHFEAPLPAAVTASEEDQEQATPDGVMPPAPPSTA